MLRVGKDTCFLGLLYRLEQLGIPLQKSHDEVIEELFENKELLTDIIAITRFKYKKRHDIIDEICEKHLDEKKIERCRFIHPRSKKPGQSYYALLLSLFLENSEYMKDLFYKNFSADKGFKRYQISPNDDLSAAIDIQEMDPAKIDKEFLEGFEKESGEGKKSHCWHMIKEPLQTEIFIRRYTLDNYVQQVYRNFLTEFSEYIIMRIYGEGDFLELHSRVLPSRKLADFFATRIFGEGHRYQLVEGKVNVNVARNFIESVSSSVDEKFVPCYIRVRNIHLPTLPQLTLRGTDHGSIVPDIGALKDKDIDLLEHIGDIERIELVYKNAKNGSIKIPIFVKVDANRQVEFSYQYNRLDDKTRESFIDHMRDEYGITVIPFRKSQVT
ncbi:MAG: hypothetical protein HXS54_10440 [Theionarchaea archaeon]|nr:hypothetical protein [Theionarchaea archaeon]